jgi:chitinase
MFGNTTDPNASNRPFDDAVVNGFDFDLEVTPDVFSNQYLGAFITKLKSLATEDTAKTSSPYYFSAAPQCPGDYDLVSSITYDMLFVQFYNNQQCDSRATSPNPTFSQWNDWATGNSAKFFVGLAAAESAAKDGGYVDSKNLNAYLDPALSFSNMAGAMFWDAS